MSTEEFLVNIQSTLRAKGTSDIFVKIVPGASNTEMKEVLQTVPLRLKIRVHAAPEKGKANQEIERFLAQIWPNTRVKVIQGFTSPLKKIRIEIKET